MKSRLLVLWMLLGMLGATLPPACQPAFATVSTTSPRNDYIGNGATATYSYTFKIFAATDLRVTTRNTSNVETTLTYPTDYTVTGVGNKNGGTITLTAGNLATNYRLTIRFDRTPRQSTDLRNQGSFLPETHEDKFDELTRYAQQLTDVVDRSLKLPETEAGSNAATTLPVAAERASQFLAFDASGNPIAATTVTTPPVSAFMETVLDDADAAAARTTLDVPSKAEAILDTLIDAKGDLIVGTASDTPARRAAPADNKVLVADAAQASGWRDGELAPIGTVMPYAGVTLPADHLWCDGATLSRATYPKLVAVLIKSSTVTADSGADLITWTVHGLRDYMPVKFSNSGGALPSGLTAGQTYWTRDTTTNSFKISTTPGGSVVDITTNGTGTHTAVVAPWGDGDGATTFNVPNLMGRIPISFGAYNLTESFSESAVTPGTDAITVAANTRKWITGQAVVLSSASPPGALADGVTYYVVRIDDTTIKLAASLANAQNGTVIDITSQGSGTHTLTASSGGSGAPIETRGLGESGGEDKHAMSISELLSHTHLASQPASGGSGLAGSTGAQFLSQATSATGGNVYMNILPPFVGMGYIIRYQ